MIWLNAGQAIKELRKLHRNLSKEEANRAIALAFNATLSKQRTFLRRHIQRRHPDSALRTAGYNSGKGILIERANRSRLYARLSVSSKPLPLRFYGAEQIGNPAKGQGVSIEVLRGKRKILPFAFFAKGKMATENVMAKGGKYSKGTFNPRKKRVKKTPSDLPITKLVGPAVGAPDPDIWPQVRMNAQKDVAKQLSKFFEKIAKGYVK